MSRLDSFIRRLDAQRRCLDHVAGLVGTSPGMVIELGLGNGRTFDHLREKLSDRRILVFERSPNPHAATVPAAGDLIVGDLLDTLPEAAHHHVGAAILVHSDIGCGDPTIDRRLANLVAGVAPVLLMSAGWAISDQELYQKDLILQELPPGVAVGRYFLYRRAIRRLEEPG